MAEQGRSRRHALSNIAYLRGADAIGFIRDLIQFADVPGCGSEEADFALRLGTRGFEDAMQVAAADRVNAQLIATRYVKDNERLPIKAMTPTAVVPLLRG